MNVFVYWVWLVGQASSGLVEFWPVSAVLLTFLLIGVALAVRRAKPRPWRRILALSAVLVMFPLLLLAAGAAWEGALSHTDVRTMFPNILILMLLILEAIAAIISVVRAKGVRILMAAIGALVFWFSLWAAFVSVMSLSGDWL